jgi:hypothetical protein
MIKIDDITVSRRFKVTFEYKGLYGYATISRLEGSLVYYLEDFKMEDSLSEDEIQNVKDMILYQLRADNI